MTEPVFVACDAGTTLVKAAVIDLSGQVLAAASQDSRLLRPSAGIVEQDLREIEAQAHAAIGRAVAASGRRADVAGVSFSSQMSGIGAVGADFEPVVPFDSWLDSRCARDIYEMAPHAEHITAISGCPPTYSHAPKQRWLKRERPRAYAETTVFQVPGPYLAARLAGLSADQAFIDNANLCFTNLSDTAAGTWSPELVDLFGLDAEKLPRIVHATDVIGTVGAWGEEATGLPAGTPVLAGGGDQIIACLGAGVNVPGRASDSAGTASLFTVGLDTWAPDVDAMSLIASQAVLPELHLGFSFINGGGQGLEWLRRDVLGQQAGQGVSFDEMQRQAEQVPAGSDGLIWLPNFQGGVTPPKPYLRGGWIGLTGAHTPGHLYRSMLEGIAYQYAGWARHASTAMGRELTEVRAMGGGAKSDLWVQIKADVLGIPFARVATSEAALVGNAMVAALGTGHVDDAVTTVDEWNVTRSVVEPDASAHAVYREYVEVFGELSDRVDESFQRLARLSASDVGSGDDTSGARPGSSPTPTLSNPA